MFIQFVVVTTTEAAELVHIAVARDGSNFNLSAEFLVDAQPEHILLQLTDYPHFKQLNSSIQESVVLKRIDAGNAQVRIVVRSCLLLFCADLTQVQQFTVGERELQATFIPDQGDFRSGWVHWRFLPDGLGTRVSLEAHLEPNFWIPPIIGLYLVKRYLRKQTLITLNAIERLGTVN